MPKPFETRIIRQRFETTGWTASEMAEAGTGVVKRGILPRLAKGLTTSDAPAPPLKEKYAKQKKRRGKSGIRDWELSGRTKRSLKVLTAKTNECTISFVDAETNKRAHVNNQLVRQFGLSPSDERILGEEFGKLPSPIKIVPKGKN